MLEPYKLRAWRKRCKLKVRLDHAKHFSLPSQRGKRASSLIQNRYSKVTASDLLALLSGMQLSCTSTMSFRDVLLGLVSVSTPERGSI